MGLTDYRGTKALTAPGGTAMFRTTVLSVVGLALVAGAHSRPASYAERAAVVTVLAESGTPARNLTAQDFVVKDGGKKLQVLDAQLSSDPLSAALLLDTAQPPPGMQPPTSELRGGTTSFVRTVLGANPDARIGVWQVGSAPIVIVEFTSKRDDLDAALGRLFFGKESGAVLLEAIDAAARKVTGMPGSRRAIVAVDFDSPEAAGMGMIQQSADSIANSGATLWAVSIRSGSSTNASREDVLEKMTKASGGKRYTTLAPSALESRLKGIAASLTSQYLVTFERPGDGPPKSLTFETAKGGKVLATPFMR
jgi:hypothetical protein